MKPVSAEKKLIPCPVCSGSTKVISDVLCCIAKCRTQFWGLSSSYWTTCINEELLALREEVERLKNPPTVNFSDYRQGVTTATLNVRP